MADEADAVWGVRLLDILDHGEEITAGYEREQIDLPPKDTVERQCQPLEYYDVA